ncbi:MAG: AraC family transcriptional regulator [Bacteroidota bacterium]
MKIQLEAIKPGLDCSFSLMFNPRLSDLFYWHFHPEYELVYIEGATATRHVGDHVSTYTDNDLVLIGSGIPHLNFDFGVTTDYRKAVVHLKKEFVEEHLLKIPELQSITTLMDKAKYGVAFTGPSKQRIGKTLFELQGLTPVKQYFKLLTILSELAKVESMELLHQQPYTPTYSPQEEGRLRTIYAYVDRNYHQKIELSELATLCNMTKEAFCRYFKKVTGYTFIAFLNRYRISQSKRHLMNGKTVGEACFRSGFESLSYYNRVFKRITGENPSVFRRQNV